MLPMQTNKGADGADEAFGGSPVRDDLTGQHRIQQLRQLRVENPIQRRTHRTTHRPHPLGENKPPHASRSRRRSQRGRASQFREWPKGRPGRVTGGCRDPGPP